MYRCKLFERPHRPHGKPFPLPGGHYRNDPFGERLEKIEPQLGGNTGLCKKYDSIEAMFADDLKQAKEVFPLKEGDNVEFLYFMGGGC